MQPCHTSHFLDKASLSPPSALECLRWLHSQRDQIEHPENRRELLDQICPAKFKIVSFTGDEINIYLHGNEDVTYYLDEDEKLPPNGLPIFGHTVIETDMDSTLTIETGAGHLINVGERAIFSIDKESGKKFKMMIHAGFAQIQAKKDAIASKTIEELLKRYPDVKIDRTDWNYIEIDQYENMTAGWHPTGGESRTYMKFDLSGVDPESVGKASLKLFHSRTGGYNTLSLGVHQATGAWREGSDTYHSGQTERAAAPGEIYWVTQPSFDPNPVTQFNPGTGAGKSIEVDITPLVKPWLSGTPNNGLVLKARGTLSGSTPESVYGFYSREHEDVDKRPVLALSAH